MRDSCLSTDSSQAPGSPATEQDQAPVMHQWATHTLFFAFRHCYALVIRGAPPSSGCPAKSPLPLLSPTPIQPWLSAELGGNEAEETLIRPDNLAQFPAAKAAARGVEEEAKGEPKVSCGEGVAEGGTAAFAMRGF